MPDKTKRKVGYELALGAVGGNASELARRAGVTPQSVLLWKKSGVIPPKRAKVLELTIGIPRKLLNPGVFG